MMSQKIGGKECLALFTEECAPTNLHSSVHPKLSCYILGTVAENRKQRSVKESELPK
jgi:hypothetical protein